MPFPTEAPVDLGQCGSCTKSGMGDSDSETPLSELSDETSSVQLESFMIDTSSDESELETVESFHFDSEADEMETVESFFLSEDESVVEGAQVSSVVLSTDHDSPLYEGSEMTVYESHLLLFQFAVRHGLSSKAFEELLQVVSAHLPETAKSPKSVHRLKRFFCKLFPDLRTREHQYCSCCLQLLEEGTPCDNDNCASAKIEKFITVPLKPQLKKKIEGIIICSYPSFLK